MHEPQTQAASLESRIDSLSIGIILTLAAIGAVLVTAASPSVADNLDLWQWHFVLRHMIFLPIALIVMFVLARQKAARLRALAFFGLMVAMIMMALALLSEEPIKGARRWLELGRISIQPSELGRPCLTVITGWLLACSQGNSKNLLKSCILTIIFVGLLLAQPDIGMAVMVVCVFYMQVFLGGLIRRTIVIAGMVISMLSIAIGAMTFPHVQNRIVRFLDSESGDHFQINQALTAFRHGGLWGRGPGEGSVKHKLPDSHADFIFPVAGEELGLIGSMSILILFTALVLRGFVRILARNDLFITIAAGGLLAQLGLQAVVNMASSLGLIPITGTPLPFISYGGSSLISTGILLGAVLSLTRLRM